MDMYQQWTYRWTPSATKASNINFVDLIHAYPGILYSSIRSLPSVSSILQECIDDERRKYDK